MGSPGSSSQSSLSADELVDRLIVMRRQEETSYAYSSYLPAGIQEGAALNTTWRERICQWAYNVVDHFDLSREVVAVTLDLYDRYLATQGNQCNGNLALLTSLTTLAIAIKLYDPKRIKITTLSNLSRGQFGPSDIEAMEFKVLHALKWKIHPPTQYAFVSHLYLFLADQVHPSVRKEVFEKARYLTELAVCDSYFVSVPNSAVALAAIINVLNEASYTKIPASARDRFAYELRARLRLDCGSADVLTARERLRTMLTGTAEDKSSLECQDSPRSAVTPSPPRKERPPRRQLEAQFQYQSQEFHDLRSVSSSSSGSARSGVRSRSSSGGDSGSCRSSPSPRRFLRTAGAGGGVAATTTTTTTSRMYAAPSPIAAGAM